MSRGRHGFYAVPENGPAARSLVADAHHCIMVQAHPRPTEYKCVGRHRPEDELPLDHPTRFRSAPSRRPTTNRQSEGLTTITPYKPAPAKAGGAFLLIDPKPQTASRNRVADAMTRSPAACERTSMLQSSAHGSGRRPARGQAPRQKWWPRRSSSLSRLASSRLASSRLASSRLASSGDSGPPQPPR